jgi:hypothetical protein
MGSPPRARSPTNTAGAVGAPARGDRKPGWPLQSKPHEQPNPGGTPKRTTARRTLPTDGKEHKEQGGSQLLQVVYGLWNRTRHTHVRGTSSRRRTSTAPCDACRLRCKQTLGYVPTSPRPRLHWKEDPLSKGRRRPYIRASGSSLSES